MKRDMEIIRRILINVEDDKYPYGGNVSLEGVPGETCAYHVALILDAGLADGEVIRSTFSPYETAMIHRLTSSGHDFLDAIRRDTIWKKVREKFLKPGGSVGLQIVIEYAKLELKRIVFSESPDGGDNGNC